MPAEIIDGRKIAAEIQAELKQKISDLKAKGVSPKLVTVLVGEDPASLSYLRGIARPAARWVYSPIALNSLPPLPRPTSSRK